jgi:hypothetical protein
MNCSFIGTARRRALHFEDPFDILDWTMKSIFTASGTSIFDTRTRSMFGANLRNNLGAEKEPHHGQLGER